MLCVYFHIHKLTLGVFYFLGTLSLKSRAFCREVFRNYKFFKGLYEILFEQDNIYEAVPNLFFGNAATELCSGGMELYNS